VGQRIPLADLAVSRSSIGLSAWPETLHSGTLCLLRLIASRQEKEITVMIWFGHDGGWSWWAWALMWVGMIVFWGVLIWGIAGLVRGSRRSDDASPERILAERFAQGEIDEEEYRRRLDVLLTPPGRGRVDRR
jgi:putative membrane protein